jgi:hypothetical protein
MISHFNDLPLDAQHIGLSKQAKEAVEKGRIDAMATQIGNKKRVEKGHYLSEPLLKPT